MLKEKAGLEVQMKTFNLKEDLKVIQFDGSFECKDKLEEVFYDYYPIEWEWENDYSDKIKLKDFPRLFNEVVAGDFVVIDTCDSPLVIEEDDFERIFEVEKSTDD